MACRGRGCDGVPLTPDTLVDNLDGTFTHTAINNTQETTIDICQIVADFCGLGGTDSLVQDVANGQFTHTAVDGDAQLVDICLYLDACSIDELGDVIVTNPQPDDFLVWNGTDWVNVPGIVPDQVDIFEFVGPSSIQHTSVDGTVVAVDICAVVAAACSDSLLPAGQTALGTNIFEHTAVDGTIQTFCEGFDSLVSANDCIQGVGLDYTIQEFSVNGKELTLNSEPVHHSASDTFGIPSVGGLVPTGVDVEIAQNCGTVTNVSNCRDMEVSFTAGGGTLNFRNDGVAQAEMNFTGQFSDDGGATWSNFASDNMVLSVPPDSLTRELSVPAKTVIRTIAPGASITFCQRFLFRDDSGNWTAGVVNFDGSIYAIQGQTI